MPIAGLIVAAVLGYVIGAVPTGVMIGRLRGVDPRRGGSGRTGATNALRTLGPALALAVLTLDVAKGVAAVLLGGLVAGAMDGSGAWGGALGGAASVLGHVRSVFIGFSGGRGVATGAGAMLIMAPLALLAAVPVLAAAIWRTRFVSLGSILAAVTVALAAAVLGAVGFVGPEAVVSAALIAAIVVTAHADNIERLRAGTERRLGDG